MATGDPVSAVWLGVEFHLRTDARLYPGVVTVGTDGVLCLEIGGSSSYVLTCMGSSVDAPDLAQDATTTESTEFTEDEPTVERKPEQL